ncbi:MAG: hypothetical protein LUQ66_06220 [Methanoregula sp.]|nr:hypothetical protein [Methanoregula sp.]
MKQNEKKRKGPVFRIGLLLFLVIIGFWCNAIIPPVAAEGKVVADISLRADPVMMDLAKDTSSQDYKSAIMSDPKARGRNTFYIMLRSAGYNYTWMTYSRYLDRMYLETLTINGTTYPSIDDLDPNYQWHIVSSLDKNAHEYTKSLADSVTSVGTYYLWYGDDRAARGCLNGRCKTLVPSVENATYIVKATVTAK